MIKDVISNIFIIKDGFSDNVDLFNINNKLINCFSTSLNDIESIKSDRLDHIKEHNLLIIKQNIFNDSVRKQLMSYFVKNYNFSMPYILFITDSILSEEEEYKLELMDSFYYIGPESTDKRYTTHFDFFIRSIFNRLHSISRINSYIIDAFKTIVDSQIIEDQRNEILLLNTELTKLSKTDYLTNLLNRRAFFDALETERKRTIREHWRINSINKVITNNEEESVLELNNYVKPKGCFFDHYGKFSCIIIDVDHFKNINDTYGHLKGDEVLKKLGTILNSPLIFRENDIIARYGGEEFVIILPETNIFHAKIPAERLRKHIKNVKFYSDDKKPFNITISIGISEFKVTDTQNEDIVNRADQALYFAKENGRDQVVVYEDIIKD